MTEKLSFNPVSKRLPIDKYEPYRYYTKLNKGEPPMDTEYEDQCVQETIGRAKYLLATQLWQCGEALRRASLLLCEHDPIADNPEYTRGMLTMLLKQVGDDPPYDSFQLLKASDEERLLLNSDMALDRVDVQLRRLLKGLIDDADRFLQPFPVRNGNRDSGVAADPEDTKDDS
jgi:hypothetical protein